MDRTTLVSFIISFVLCFSIPVIGQLFADDNCRTTKGLDGVCKFITQCPAALNDLKKGIFPRDICGFSGTQSIICCVGSTTSKPSPHTVKPVTSATPKPNTSKPVTSSSIVGSYPGAKAEAMCKEYSQYAYERIVSPTLAATSSFSTTLECTISTQPLIVGGTRAARREFPHMVQIGYITGTEIDWACGGSLISSTFVLTAAHCLKSISKGDAKLARAGITNQSDTYHVQQRNVIERIKHPDYSFQKYHDIALLRLDRGFDLNTYVRPACLFTKKNIPYANSIASGWGKTDFAIDEGSEDLLKVTLEFFRVDRCNNTYRRMVNQANSDLSLGIVDDWMICAGSSTESKDTCQGDSGGPLQIRHPDGQNIKCMYDIVGITSFGIACGLAKNLPGVYTRVSHYIKWIEDIVWP